MKKALSETKGCDDLERLNHMKRIFFTHRQVSVAEATYRLIPGMYLKSSSVKTTFVSSGYPENRSLMFVKVKEDLNDESDSDEENANSRFKGQKEQFDINWCIFVYRKPCVEFGDMNHSFVKILLDD